MQYFWAFVAAGGGGAVIAFGIIRAFGEKWLDSKFAGRLQDLRHEHERQMESVRLETSRTLDRSTRLSEREFEVSAEAWALIFEAYVRTMGALPGLLEAAGAPDPQVVTERWMRKYNVSGQSPESVARQGGEPFATLLQRIESLRRMANARYESYVVDDLCGLSLRTLRDKRLREQEEREAKRLKELADAAAARREYLERDARQDLGDEASEWLCSPSPDHIKTILEWAGVNDAQLQVAERQLGEAIRNRKARLAAAEAIRGYQQQLEVKVRAAIADRQRAELFLNAWRSTCDSPAALNAILAKLPKRR